MKKILFITIVFSLLFPALSSAKERPVITDWYIQDFQSEIIVNTDSSITVTEKITADCGNLPDKHGIFRILQTQINTNDQGIIKTPVNLISITDFNGIPYNYSASTDTKNHTVAWKIGDADKTVTGVNYYKIIYRVENAVRTHNPNFDEFYWNLNGNFWDIEIDNFSAIINFPAEINQSNSQVEYYTGSVGSKSKDLASFNWTSDNSLQFNSTKTIPTQQGVTTSVTFPKNIVTPYKAPLSEKYGWLVIFILPFVIFIICFWIWKKYGDDPKWDKTVIAEYDVPENLTPIEMGALQNNGKIYPSYITATIIHLAVNGIITIEEIKKEGLINILDSVELKFHYKDRSKNLKKSEAMILKILFNEDLLSDTTTLSDIKRWLRANPSFPKELEKNIINELRLKNLILTSGNKAKKIILPIGFLMLFSSSIAFGIFLPLGFGILFSSLIAIFFAFIMPKRTLKGAEVNWKIKGFKLYMETAEKYRQQFFEKENMFEKLLPYAMVFGMTKEWIKKMEEIYGKDYFTTYHPAWYAGGTLASFDADGFTSQLNSISSSMNAVSSSASGSGGGGSSGGGGGGGGGGGW